MNFNIASINIATISESVLSSFSLTSLALQTIAMALTSWLIPRLRITSIIGALLMVVAISVMNQTVWSAALLLNIPDNVSMHTVTLFVSNGALFWILVKILPGIEVDGFFPALIAPLVYTVVAIVVTRYGPMIPWEQIFSTGLSTVTSIRDSMRTP